MTPTWVNGLMTVYVWFYIGVFVIYLFLGPILIGKQKTGEHTIWEWMGKIIGGVITGLIFGRALGWW